MGNFLSNRSSSGNQRDFYRRHMAEPEDMMYQYLDTTGDGTGIIAATGNYSDAGDGLTKFFCAPPAGTQLIVHRMVVSIEDVGSMDSGAYGNNITLTNGIELHVDQDGTSIKELTAGDPIITNADWAHLCYDLNVFTFGQGNEHLGIRWTFTKSGSPIFLDGNKNQALAIYLNDNFTGLVDQKFQVQGYFER